MLKRVLLSIVVLGVTGVSMLGSNLSEDTNPRKSIKKIYILRLSEDRAVKTKLVGTLRHSAVFSGVTQDSTFTVFIPIIPGNGGLDRDRVEVEIRPKKKMSEEEKVRIVRFDKSQR